jgi:pilus assembly protein CpaF
VTSTQVPDEHLVAALCRAAAAERGDTAAVVRAQLRRIAPLAGDALGEQLVRAAVARLEGLGALDTLVADPTVDEVLVNARGDIWVERDGSLQRAGHLPAADLALVTERILAPIGRRLDRANPVVDARLPDGSRVCAVIPPVSPDGGCLSIRRFRDRTRGLGAFATGAVAALLERLVAARCNVVVSGATSSGKTSLLNAALGHCPPDERIVTIEDTLELLPDVDHLVRLEARPATPDGPAEITLEQLVRTALRLRPDRLVVGEVRGPEVLALVQALNTGHDGSWSTCHANSCLDALHRLETLVVQAAAAWPLRAVREQLTRSIDVVVHVARRRDGARRVVEVAEVAADRDELALRTLVRAGEVVAELHRTRA